ncbi:2Fe-2S iron-sulfur cluster-binding protein [Undibacter mobilis]|uniref:2Fe-2S ferredoxin n=1 Tax=Undibacter mobilis TaxID=2292256 RepID=A0A371B3G3_9BRAD|nr:2Fe-2S iron-sulfur cluster-binding protein [Undibacter mobilis]RDV02037.1 2Fe-2S ferredoxin [Undibacter mobilis]
MPTLTFIDSTGRHRQVDSDAGLSLMEVARRNDIPEIIAECGGQCACATCHVYVEPEWLSKTGPISELEQDLLNFSEDVRPTSRLSCQVQVTDELDGIIVHTPSKQG